MNQKILLLATLLFLSCAPAFGQRGQSSERPVRDTRPTDRPAPSVTPAPSPASPSVGRTAPGVYRDTVRDFPGGSAAPGGSPGGGVVIPIQNYGWGNYLDSGDWYRYNLFLGRLYDRYSFLPVNDYLWRYAQGDSALTPESVRFALRDSVNASRSLQQLGQDLNDLIDAYSRGEITQREFSSQLQEISKEIRNSAKQIRKDYFLDYLEQNNSGLVPDYSEPRSLEQLRGLSAALMQTSDKIGDLLDGYITRETTRVVSIDDLKEVSAETLAKRIDRMAKAIERSGRNL